MNNYQEEFSLEHWNNVSSAEGGGVRAAWGWDQIKTRTDETVSSELNYEKSDTVLDLGCGVGYACKMVAPQVKKYIGLDYSSGMVSQAKEVNKDFGNAEFFVGDGVSIPFEDNFFDIIFCEQVFQHMNEDDSYLYFKEILRTVKSDGSFILQIPKFGRPAAGGVGMSKEDLSEFFDKKDLFDGALDPAGFVHYYYIKHGNKINS